MKTLQTSFITIILLTIFGLGLSSVNAAEVCGTRYLAAKKTKSKLVKQRFVEYKNTKWRPGQTIRVVFLGGTQKQKNFVKKYAVEWTKYANLKFVFYNRPSDYSGRSDIRITFKKSEGSYSYIGIQNKQISQNRNTMNFGWESRGTVLHEFGHALGLAHEHKSPAKGIPWNKRVVYRDMAKQGWSRSQVDRNILEQLSSNSVNFSTFDRKSIMIYSFPKEWTLNGIAVARTSELSKMDIRGISNMYPGRNNVDETETNPTTTTETETETETETTTTKPTDPVRFKIRSVKINKNYSHHGDKAVRFDVGKVDLYNMKGKKVHFGFYVIQKKKGISWVGLEPQMIKYDYTVWKSGFWFFYKYNELRRLGGNLAKPFRGCFYIVQTSNNKTIGTKCVNFRIKSSSTSTSTPTTETTDSGNSKRVSKSGVNVTVVKIKNTLKGYKRFKVTAVNTTSGSRSINLNILLGKNGSKGKCLVFLGIKRGASKTSRKQCRMRGASDSWNIRLNKVYKFILR